MARLLWRLIRLYRRFVSPILPPACRFYPSCARYALQALEQKPLGQAIWLIVCRVAKCHPLHPGGYDPLPANDARKDGLRANRGIRSDSALQSGQMFRHGAGQAPRIERK